jgi:hypothetical protein
MELGGPGVGVEVEGAYRRRSIEFGTEPAVLHIHNGSERAPREARNTYDLVFDFAYCSELHAVAISGLALILRPVH